MKTKLSIKNMIKKTFQTWNCQIEKLEERSIFIYRQWMTKCHKRKKEMIFVKVHPTIFSYEIFW